MLSSRVRCPNHGTAGTNTAQRAQKIDLDAKRYQHRTEGILIGECRLTTQAGKSKKISPARPFPLYFATFSRYG
jgi:hypothetical protein